MAFEAEIENSTIKINELQEKLENSNTEKAAAETQLGQLRSSYEKLAAEFDELKRTSLRIAALESEAASREQTLSQSAQKVTDLTNALDREKKDQELLRAELSTKADLVAELQQKLEATLASRSKLEDEIEKSKNENAALQGQLSDLKAQKTTSDTQLEQQEPKKMMSVRDGNRSISRSNTR